MTLLPDLQRWMDEAAGRHGVPGAAIAVGVGTDLAEAATGVVNRDTRVETTPDTVFQVGSVTKLWTASLVLQLVHDGLIDLDTPVRHYLPEFGIVDPVATETVTPRHLMSHTAGFAGDLFEDTGRGDDALDKYLAYLHTGATQVSRPGELFSYGNSGWCVLGALVARLRGGTWESVLRERLIEPLGATHMALFADEAILFRAAAGHIDGHVVRKWMMPRSNGPAGSTLCAAPRELVRFGRMFLADGVSESGARLLPAGAFAAMCEPQVTLPPMSERAQARQGLGFALYEWDGVPVVGHDGGTPGQSTCWRIVPDRGVVVAFTTNGGASGAFADDVLTAVLAETAGLRVPPRPLPPTSPVPFSPEALVGRFAGPLETYDVAATTDGLDITTTPNAFLADFGETPTTTRYVPLGGDRFITAEPEDGIHPTLAFLHNGRYLFGSRALPRLPA